MKQCERPPLDPEYLAELHRRIKASDKKRKEWKPRLKISKHEILLVLERETQWGGKGVIAEYPYIYWDDNDVMVTVLTWHITTWGGVGGSDEFVRGKEKAIMRVTNIALKHIIE